MEYPSNTWLGSKRHQTRLPTSISWMTTLPWPLCMERALPLTQHKSTHLLWTLLPETKLLSQKYVPISKIMMAELISLTYAITMKVWAFMHTISQRLTRFWQIYFILAKRSPTCGGMSLNDNSLVLSMHMSRRKVAKCTLKRWSCGF